MDVLLISLAAFFVLLGIVGSFLPLIPGPLTGWTGILLLSLAPSITIQNQFLIFSFCIALGIFILDNIIPVLGVKKFGGGKASIIGSSIGLLIGVLFLGPFGLLIGLFSGALIGELVANFSDKKGALKAAYGALIGFFTGVFLKLTVGVAFAFFFVRTLWSFWFD
tara:strand:- start:23 stop:517 length:495 start_codon:yes stop_codon:yes gene_type:complete